MTTISLLRLGEGPWMRAKRALRFFRATIQYPERQRAVTRIRGLEVAKAFGVIVDDGTAPLSDDFSQLRREYM